MQLEISFHNAYHYKKSNVTSNLSLPPDQDYDDHLHYPDLIQASESGVQEKQLPSSVTQLHYSNHNNLCIEDTNKEIRSIETNNPRCIKISTKIKKGLFKKVKIYTIVCNGGNGNIKIKYKNGKPTEIKSFFGNENIDRVKIGSLSGDTDDYWLGEDPFIGNKYIDCLYTNETTKDSLENHINICYKMGAECKFVYHKFIIADLTNPEYILQYISDFTEYIRCIANNKYSEMAYSVIYEPDLITDIYNTGNRNPNNIYINSTEGKMNLIHFINKMETICTSQGIEFVNVFNPCILTDIFYHVTETVDFDRYINNIKRKAKQIAEYYSYFKNQSTRYFAFKSLRDCKSNDEYLAYLVLVKCIIELLELKGIIFDIPVGHVNSIQGISRYTNKPYDNHTDKQGDYQSLATFFFFGGCAIFNETKFHQNKFQDTGLKVNGSTVFCDEHLSLCNTFNIKYIMFGPTSIEDTTNVPLNSRGNKCTDHNYTITKIMEYINQL